MGDVGIGPAEVMGEFVNGDMGDQVRDFDITPRLPLG